jgi:transcriptional regulator with XRE-family HTH domain|tara:strand:- start:193 stop:504 length:312 start_codon:yes stop_codon:yes gene_type:complete
MNNISANSQEKLPRREILTQVEQGVARGDLQLGEGLQRLRKEISGLNQKDFAKLSGISLRTLAGIESGQANPTLETINQLFSLFGLRVGLVSKYSEANPNKIR